jgi:membrane-associated phospholipid phosphatase
MPTDRDSVAAPADAPAKNFHDPAPTRGILLAQSFPVSRQHAGRLNILTGYGVVLAVFIVLATTVYSHHVLQADITITRTLQRYHPNWFDWFMLRISDPGEPRGAVLSGVIVAVVLIALHLRLEAAIAFVATLLAMGAGDLLKLLVNRPRPTPGLVRVAQHINERSFPSGHAIQYTVLCGFLCYVVLVRWPNSALRNVGLVLLALPVPLVGLSRVYLGEHWATDVLGGYLVGAIVLALAIQVYGRLRPQSGDRRSLQAPLSPAPTPP